MDTQQQDLITQARNAAEQILIHNNHGPFRGLPRTAGWGYPEPYTRDMMICGLGFLTSGNKDLINSFRKVLVTLAEHQSPLGHISSLANDPMDRGSSDCTPLFLVGLGIWRLATGENDFLQEAAHKALTWMQYRSPADNFLVAQMPTSDWRDEQWVLGYGLFVNTLVYTYLKFFGHNEHAEVVRGEMAKFTVTGDTQNRHVHEGLTLKHKPYLALWSYKIYKSERFDLLGNSLAILSGLASRSRSRKMIDWIEDECKAMMQRNDLVVDCTPNFFPFTLPADPDWIDRYEHYNRPGDYHNGGIWPFVCGFYIAALVAAEKYKLAEEKLYQLAKLCKLGVNKELEFGFNEWYKAQDGLPKGNDYQSWSAAMFIYACECVAQKKTPFFDQIRPNDNCEDEQ